MFKSALVVSESIYLKTKMLTFDHPFAIYNNTPFRFMIKKINSHIQPNKAMTASTSAVVAEVLPNCLAHYPVKLREEDIIAICFNEKAENTISITFGELRNSKLLSYNFCKLFPT